MKFVIVCLFLLIAAPALAQSTFEVNARTNCGTQLSSVAVSRVLTAGTHTFTMSGAWSPFASNGANGGKSWGAYVDVKIAGTGTSQRFAVAPVWQATPTAAEALVTGVVFTIQLDTESTVYFYNPDAFLNNNNNGICGDNRGSVFITLDASPVGQDQRSWGIIKAHYLR